MLKVLAEQAGVRRLDLANSRLMLTFSPAHQSDPEALAAMVATDGGRFALSPDGVLRVHLQRSGELGQLVEAKNILQEIRQRVSC
jgi:transcription-repair coupling factor (superfamily II helicase)